MGQPLRQWSRPCKARQRGDTQQEQPSAWIAAEGHKARDQATIAVLEPGRYALSLTPRDAGPQHRTRLLGGHERRAARHSR